MSSHPLPDRPAPGSHDRRTPTGSLEESAAAIYEAALAARDAESRGNPDRRALHAFYRTVMNGTLLLPVPPEHGEEAKAALASAVTDDEEVEVAVMLARDGEGQPVRGAFGVGAASHREPPPAGADRDREPGRGRDAGNSRSRGTDPLPIRAGRA